MTEAKLPDHCYRWGGNAVRIFYDIDKSLEIVERDYIASKISSQSRKIVVSDGLEWFAEEYTEKNNPYIEIFGSDMDKIAKVAKKVIAHIKKHKNVFLVSKPTK